MEFSQARAEAQYRIGQTIEAKHQHSLEQLQAQGKQVTPMQKRTPEAAIVQYRKVARTYRDSEFAGRALAKEIRYYIDTKDLVQANELLERVFEDYPDAQFLDEMLVNWTVVLFQMGDYEKAHEKCQQLLVEFPDSRYAAQAQREWLPTIKQRLEQ